MDWVTKATSGSTSGLGDACEATDCDEESLPDGDDGGALQAAAGTNRIMITSDLTARSISDAPAVLPLVSRACDATPLRRLPPLGSAWTCEDSDKRNCSRNVDNYNLDSHLSPFAISSKYSKVFLNWPD